MSNVVQFLESLSLTPEVLGERQYAEAVAAAGLDAEARRALEHRDAAELSRLLGGRATVMALVFPAEDEPNTDEPDSEPDSEPKEGDHVSRTDALAA